MKELQATYSERDKVLQLYLEGDLIHIETLPTTEDYWFYEEIKKVKYDFNFNEHPEKGAYSLVKYEMFIDDDNLLQTDPGNFETVKLKIE